MNSAKLYRNERGLQLKDSIYVMENYLKYFKCHRSKSNILDIGSGDGYTFCEILLPKLGDQVEFAFGIDKSSDMVNFCKKEYGNECVIFKQMDIGVAEVPIEFHGNFDNIFSFFCLHWVSNQSIAYENIHKMLKPNGSILLVYLAKNPIYEIYEEMAKMDEWKAYMKRYKEYISPFQVSVDPASEVEKIMKRIGFQVEVCKVEKRCYTFPNMEVLRDSVRAVSPFLSQIPNEKHCDYFEDYIAVMRKLNTVQIKPSKNNNKEEIIECSYHILIAIAKKKEH